MVAAARCVPTGDPLLLDHLDEQIVALLVEDARSTYAAIGAQVGLSAPAVKRRVDRLVDDGVVRGFTAVVDREAAGPRVEAFVELYCKARTAPMQVREMVVDLPQVVSCWTVTGDPDALLLVRTPDIAGLEETLGRIGEHPNAERTKSIVVLSRLIDTDRGL